MKRIWIGLGLLGLLLVLGFVTSNKMEHVHTAISHRLEQAVETAVWEEAAALSQEAEAQWQQHSHFTASLADHEHIDQIDSLFAQLKVYRSNADALSHAATCAYLAESVTALKEAHRLTWWNLL